MSEEEKELIKEFKEELSKDLKDLENVNDTFLMVTMHNIEMIVNLIEKQEKVINKMAKDIIFLGTNPDLKPEELIQDYYKYLEYLDSLKKESKDD